MTEAAVDVLVEGTTLSGTLMEPSKLVPGVLFIHGWGGNQGNDLALARRISRLGCICFTFDMRGHGETVEQGSTVTREDNLEDVLAAYDLLVCQDAVDTNAIAVIGSSYGGYLAAILTSMREVDWLILRVPALYRDADWDTPKAKLDRQDLNKYRQTYLSIESNRALRACAEFKGDALIVESENDEMVAHPAVASYAAAFRQAHSMTHRIIDDADHTLSKPRWREAYIHMVSRWMTDMIATARERGS